MPDPVRAAGEAPLRVGKFVVHDSKDVVLHGLGGRRRGAEGRCGVL